MNNHKIVYSHFKILIVPFMDFLQIKITHKAVQSEHKDNSGAKEPEDPEKESLDIKPYATPEDIETGKLPPEEILSLPMFKVPT